MSVFDHYRREESNSPHQLLAAGYPNSSNGRLSAGLETDIPLTPTSPGGPAAPRRRRLHLARAVLAAAIFALLLLTLTALLAATVQRCRREGGAGCLIPQALVAQPWGGSGSSLWPPKKRVSRVAFGSCTAHDVQAQPIWEEVRAGACWAARSKPGTCCAASSDTGPPAPKHPTHTSTLFAPPMPGHNSQ